MWEKNASAEERASLRVLAGGNSEALSGGGPWGHYY
jgi:hypothetical protein